MKRAVITGRGVLSPLGCDWASFASALRSGAAPDPKPFPGALPDDPILCHLLSDDDALASLASSRGGEPLSGLVTAAASQALEEASLTFEGGSLDAVGLVMNTVFGPSTALEAYLERLLDKGPRAARPAQFVDTLLSMPASRLGIALRLRGSTAVLGGSSALELAFDWVRSGRDRAIVAGGGEFQSPKCLRYLRELVRRSGAERAPPAQGAAFVVLEEAEQARLRSAAPLAEVLAAGAASEPQDVALPWSADPEGRAFACAMGAALAEAGLKPGDLTAAVLAAGDDASEQSELAAIEAVLGRPGDALTLLRPKRLFGEALGASEALALLTALAHVESAGAATVMVNAFEMGGAVTSLIVRSAGA